MVNKLSALKKPSAETLQDFKNFWGNQGEEPLVPAEGFLFDEDDLVAMADPGDTAWIDDFIMEVLSMIEWPPIWKLFSDKSLIATNAESETTITFSTRKLEAFTTTVTALLIMALLCGPLYPLFLWTQGPLDGGAMARIMALQCGCTFLFGGVLALCTRARRLEVFVGCSAYMAILVVFMGQARS